MGGNENAQHVMICGFAEIPGLGSTPNEIDLISHI